MRSERYHTVDALRGIAALSVAVFHLSGHSFEGTDSALTALLSAIFQYGYLGVPIFFVISGFVIAATLNPPDVNFHYIGKFVAKRATRLDPPYWLSIAVDIGLVYLTIYLFRLPSEVPSAAQIVSHIFYLQNLLGYGDIAANYWTLCFEVQFYLFLSLIFAGARMLTGANSDPRRAQRFIFAVFFGAVLLSLLIAAGWLANPKPGLFISHWYLFGLGVACYWSAIAKRISKGVFAVFCLCALGLFFVQAQASITVALNTLLALLTAVFLYAAASRRKMSSWLNNRVLLYLGSISYSLYLFHAIIGDRFIAFIKEWLLPRFGVDHYSSFLVIVVFLASLAVSIIAAHAVYWLLEKPSVKLSKKIRPERPSSILNDIRGIATPEKYASAN